MSNKKGKKAKGLIDDVVGSPHKIQEKHMHSGVYLVGKNDGQKEAIKIIQSHEISVIHGVPGSGKTHIALTLGLIGLLNGTYAKMILTRPYVEAGEKMGYLPGDMGHKYAPFMLPLMEISIEHLGKNVITDLIEKGNIQILPLAFMRGVTFKNSFVVADEMQNATPQQMRLILTRNGENSKIVITGDTEQSDLYFKDKELKNGLTDCIERLKPISEIGFVEMLEEHCVRSPLVAKIDRLYKNK